MNRTKRNMILGTFGVLLSAAEIVGIAWLLKYILAVCLTKVFNTSMGSVNEWAWLTIGVIFVGLGVKFTGSILELMFHEVPPGRFALTNNASRLLTLGMPKMRLIVGNENRIALVHILETLFTVGKESTFREGKRPFAFPNGVEFEGKTSGGQTGIYFSPDNAVLTWRPNLASAKTANAFLTESAADPDGFVRPLLGAFFRYAFLQCVDFDEARRIVGREVNATFQAWLVNEPESQKLIDKLGIVVENITVADINQSEESMRADKVRRASLTYAESLAAIYRQMFGTEMSADIAGAGQDTKWKVEMAETILKRGERGIVFQDIRIDDEGGGRGRTPRRLNIP